MKKIILLLLAALCFSVPVLSQNSQRLSPVISLDTAVSRLQTLSADKAIEKPYLHFDKPYYNAGDTLYFKAYVTLGEQHELSKLSGILHVDLISPTGSLLKSISLQLANGLAVGDFSLPNTLPGGSYRIRAYTKWMLNNGQVNFFDRRININNGPPAGNKAGIAKAGVEFFPEGGRFVSSIPAKLAFKAVGTNGLGVNVKGVVVDNTNAEVTKFESTHLGMGLIFITPEAGKTYKANLTYADGTKATVDLPKADNEGISLMVNNDSADKLGIEINANKAYYLKNKNKEIGVIIYSAGDVRSVKAVLDNQVLDLNLNKKDFKTGVVQVTLFSAQGELLNERLAFIQNPDLLTIAPTCDKTLYSERGKVHISINTKNKNGEAVKSYLSATVVDAGKVPSAEDDENTILSNLLLTSDLKGKIEQPNYYFVNVNNDTRANLDILMLTRNFSRFEWKQLLSNEKPAKVYSAENGFDISGQVKTTTGKPVDGGIVTLMPRAGGALLSQNTDHEGNFAFRNMVYSDETTFVIQAKTATGGNNTHISVYLEPTLANINTEDIISPVKDSNITRNDQTMQQPVYLADANKRGFNAVINSDKRAGERQHTTETLDDKNVRDQSLLTTGLEGRLPGVILRDGVPFLADKANAVMQTGPMLIIADDTAMPAGTSVNNYNPVDVESITVLKNSDAAIYGIRGANGVLIIKMRKSASSGMVKDIALPGLLYYTAQGFYKARTFYSPVYEGSQQTANKPDARSTIYWNPDMVTDKDGNASFDFFNADGKGTYRLVIEGIDEAGNIGRSVLTYKVQ
ncbi:TonB-dependent receptor plug domain-containing protein [Mucilaginibacter kameinonensis]|uniref:TonB-dependent receptor plug domain-containing protein n=1 Tax=Mucilaginibacter kameinonensis TaxID=452286 RepID=UPI000EF85286|nr:TonB-dependent receptor plug domain-containing protein [Mucilaginibacter kameinonensis]